MAGLATFTCFTVLDKRSGAKAVSADLNKAVGIVSATVSAPFFAEQERARRHEDALHHTVDRQSDLIAAIAEGRATIRPVGSHAESLAERRDRVAATERGS